MKKTFEVNKRHSIKLVEQPISRKLAESKLIYTAKWVILLILLAGSEISMAQKFGYIDSEYITSKMPDYQKAVESMNTYSEKWVKDIQTKTNELAQAKLKYQQEEILLTDEMKRERLADLEKRETELKELNNQIFGFEGMLFQKKKELMKPIMEEVFKACQKVARQRKLMFIFDKAADISMIYTDPRHDYTDYVMEAMGLKTANAKQTNR